VVAAAVSAPVFLVGVPAANATCIPGSVTLYPKPHVELPRCEPPPQ
jgi:hypothetical protein